MFILTDSNISDITRGIQYFLSLIVFCGLMYIWDLFHLGIVNYTFYLSKGKIQYRYDHLFAHRTNLHNHTLIHCRFNMSRKPDKSHCRFNISRKPDKSPGEFGGLCWFDIIWFQLEIPHWKKFPVKRMSILYLRTLFTDVLMISIEMEYQFFTTNILGDHFLQ